MVVHDYFRRMSQYTKKQLFEDWLMRMPLVQTPVTLGEETHQTFTENQLPLAQALIDAFILPYETEGEADEFTEYIPCFRVEHSGKHQICVYWRVSLLNYTYFIATYDSDGHQVGRALIAGTFVIDNQLVHRVAHLPDALHVLISEGYSDVETNTFDASGSVKTQIKIAENGSIVYLSPSDK
jgi:hypothetical protein